MDPVPRVLPSAPRAALLQELEMVVEALDVGHHPTCLVFWDG